MLYTFYNDFNSIKNKFESIEDKRLLTPLLINVMKILTLAYNYIIRNMPNTPENEDLIDVLFLEQRHLKESIKLLRYMDKYFIRQYYYLAYDELDIFKTIIDKYRTHETNIYNEEIISADMKDIMCEFECFICTICNFVYSYTEELGEFLLEKYNEHKIIIGH